MLLPPLHQSLHPSCPFFFSHPLVPALALTRPRCAPAELSRMLPTPLHSYILHTLDTLVSRSARTNTLLLHNLSWTLDFRHWTWLVDTDEKQNSIVDFLSILVRVRNSYIHIYVYIENTYSLNFYSKITMKIIRLYVAFSFYYQLTS